MRKCKVDEDNAIDGNTDNVEKYFADMSENLYLYTSLGEKAEVLELGKKLEDRMNSLSKRIKDAMKKLNAGQTDPSFCFLTVWG